MCKVSDSNNYIQDVVSSTWDRTCTRITKCTISNPDLRTWHDTLSVQLTAKLSPDGKMITGSSSPRVIADTYIEEQQAKRAELPHPYVLPPQPFSRIARSVYVAHNYDGEAPTLQTPRIVEQLEVHHEFSIVRRADDGAFPGLDAPSTA
ncbi:hypothetical protein CIB48_g1069 [Xylaria polymorpha]|nr:hypothetical protein CIB48_g1069 [Xylaria polymorpha]